MMTTRHTPGPWWATESGVRDSGGYICHTNQPFHYPGQDERYANEIAERKANKVLIAAAPDLLEALKLCAAVCAGETMSKNGLIAALESARAALAKATIDQ